MPHQHAPAVLGVHHPLLPLVIGRESGRGSRAGCGAYAQTGGPRGGTRACVFLTCSAPGLCDASPRGQGPAARLAAAAFGFPRRPDAPFAAWKRAPEEALPTQCASWRKAGRAFPFFRRKPLQVPRKQGLDGRNTRQEQGLDGRNTRPRR
jgi:hypothetical protein